MPVINQDTEVYLREFSELYVQIGVLEKLLRVTIPYSLGSNPHDRLDLNWVQRLPLDELNQKRFKKALTRRNLERKSRLPSITDSLPFGFWKNILHSRNFTLTWIPYTHTILSSTNNSKSFEIFKEFELHFNQAHNDRNLIAHYNTPLIKDIYASLENVRWLQEAMGLVKAE
jgi:hypothetical protein